MPDRRQDILETVPLLPVIVDVPRGHDRDPEPVGQAGQAADPLGVPADPVVLELDEEAVGAERIEESLRECLSRRRRILERTEEGAPPATGEEDEPLGVLEEKRQGEGRGAPGARAVCFGEDPTKVRVPRRRLGEESQVEEIRRLVRSGGSGGGGTGCVGGRAERRGARQGGSVGSSRGGAIGAWARHASRALSGKPALPDRDLGSRDRLEALLLRGPGELHGPVEAVVVGEGERRIAELLRALDELLGMRGPVQEGVARVGVELDVRRRGRGHGIIGYSVLPTRIYTEYRGRDNAVTLFRLACPDAAAARYLVVSTALNASAGPTEILGERCPSEEARRRFCTGGPRSCLRRTLREPKRGYSSSTSLRKATVLGQAC